MADEQKVLDDIEKMYGSGDIEKAPKAKVKDVPEAKPVQKQPAAAITTEKADEKPIETKVEDKKPEAKTESAQPKPEVKTEKIETKADDFYDPLENKKSKGTKKAEVKATPAAQSFTEDQLKEFQNLDTYKKESELFRKIKGTPLGEILLEAQEMGKNPMEVLSELQPKDFRAMNDEGQAREYFSRIEGLSGDALDTEVENFLSLDDGYYKNAEKRKFVSQLEAFQSQRASKYLSGIKNASNEAQKIAEQFDKDVESVLKESYKGKKPYGIDLSPEQYSEFEDSVRNFTLRDDDGNIDAQRVAFMVFAEKHLRSMRKNDYMKGRSEGAEEVLKSVHNPDRNDQSLQNRPVQPAQKKAEDDIEERFGNTAPQRVQ